MIPVYQTMSLANDGEGNCFNACIASILELPLREVAAIHPKFDGDYWGAWEDWFAERGLFMNHRGLRDAPPRGYAIANGRSGRIYPEGHKKAANASTMPASYSTASWFTIPIRSKASSATSPATGPSIRSRRNSGPTSMIARGGPPDVRTI